MYELAPMMFFFAIGAIVMSVTMFKDYKKASVCFFLVGMLLITVSIKSTTDRWAVRSSISHYEAQIVQSEELKTGQVIQYIIDGEGDKIYLSSNRWHPPVTYCKYNYGSGSMLWFFDHEIEEFVFFTV